MPVTTSFVRAWHRWIREPIPASNFRQNRSNAPTYEVEHDLAHLESYLYSIGEKAIARQVTNYKEIANNELIELNAIATKLNSCDITVDEKATFKRYIESTRTLLEELSNVESE